MIVKANPWSIVNQQCVFELSTRIHCKEFKKIFMECKYNFLYMKFFYIMFIKFFFQENGYSLHKIFG
jgi:hypothetical protein